MYKFLQGLAALVIFESERPSLPVTQNKNPAPYKPHYNRKSTTAAACTI